MVQFKPEGRKRLMFWLKSARWEEPPILILFVVFKPSIDWMRPTHTGRAICFLWSTHSNVNLIQKLPHMHTQNV